MDGRDAARLRALRLLRQESELAGLRPEAGLPCAEAGEQDGRAVARSAARETLCPRGMHGSNKMNISARLQALEDDEGRLEMHHLLGFPHFENAAKSLPKGHSLEPTGGSL